MSGKLTLLGTGSSGGVPRLGNNWGACDPTNPKNRRRRCAALVERISGRGRTRVLVDAPPDLREQLLDAEVGTIDGVLFTHDHADHTHGIDDLRMLAYNAKRRVDVHFDVATRASLYERFGYCFETPTGSMYPPILNGRIIDPPNPVRIDGAAGPVEAIPVVQAHGDAFSLGFRFADVAYSPDISGLTSEAQDQLRNLDLWIVDALRYIPHPSHFTVAQALEWIEKLKPKRAILTHLHVDLDYATLKRELPPHVEPAYDGMAVHFDWSSG
jgi:phosphoribosyl 1,2-cyclic phosphate phosphodiesterase